MPRRTSRSLPKSSEPSKRPRMALADAKSLPLRHRGNGQPVWLLPALVVVVGLICGLPLLRLAFRASEAVFAGEGGSVFLDPMTWRATRNTLIVSIVGTVISIVLGALFAIPVALTDIRGRAALALAFMLPMMIPPQITALAWVQMTGPSSALLNAIALAPPLGSPQPLYSRGGIALLIGVQNAPLVFLSMMAGLTAVPRDLVEAARLAGARQREVLASIALPLALPGLVAGAALAFVSGVGNFGIPAILGLPSSILTLPTLIYVRLASFGTGTLGDMALLSGLVAALAIFGIWVQTRAMRGRSLRTVGHAGRPVRFELGAGKLPVQLLLWFVLFFILVAPFLALVSTSLLPTYGVRLTLETASLAAYRAVLFTQSMTVSAFTNSFLLAGLAAFGLLLVTLPLGWYLARGRSRLSGLLASTIEVPYALPGIVVAVACILLFAAPLPVIGVSLYGTLWIILFAYLASFMAVSLKPVAAAFSQIDPALEEAARLTGAGFVRRMTTITLPLAAPAAGAAVILVFLIAVNELTISALLWSAGTQTLGVAVFNLDDSGEATLAAALSVIIVIMVLALMLALDRLAARLPKGVVPWRV
ncbi:MAG: iron ABC transporter permease [Rhizobiaceae bacterium]|nr:iron ABC transporter permease [Rhizobiaceae bacterium]MCV0408579.1 iron ABC transporter permease [Rhizobiaceae bacterium]